MLRQDQNPISTPTPTVQINRIGGFSLDILGELYSKNVLTTPEIASNLNRKQSYVRVYLHRLYKYGCIERKARWGWIIEPLGTDILRNNNNNIGNKRATTKQQKSNKRVTETSNDSRTTVSRQLNLSLYESDPNVTEPEREVVMLMVSHYERTGEKYRYFKDIYDFCEQTGLSAVGVMELLAKLKQEGVIYMREEKMLGMWKIGLKVNFIERLQHC